MLKMFQFLRYTVLEIILLIICIFLAKTAPGFLSKSNLLGILSNISVEGVVALGMTIVIISGEIDLSVGSAAAWSACSMAWMVQAFDNHHMNMVLAIALAGSIAVGVGALIGALTGWLRMRFRVPTFITTLAWFAILRSAAKILTGNFPISPFPDWFSFLGSGFVLGVPFPAILFLLTFAVVHFLMNHTPFGRAVYAVGGNAEAARLSGIRVTGIKILAMATVAALAAFGGIMQASKIQAGSPDSCMGMELDVIAAVIIGGTSLTGGAGKVWGTLVGLVFLGVLANGMTLRNDDTNWQGIATGVLILVAVLLNMRSLKKT
jgi:sugar transport system permease protein